MGTDRKFVIPHLGHDTASSMLSILSGNTRIIKPRDKVCQRGAAPERGKTGVFEIAAKRMGEHFRCLPMGYFNDTYIYEEERRQSRGGKEKRTSLRGSRQSLMWGCKT